ncbi:glycoside hydrolase family 18 protein [Xylariaceae sp. AK1471]|nr:glycoside hydrolase family 18 protein [Xylariaceae sp. AK1471]
MASDQLINAVYYPSWRIYRGFPPSSLQLECVNRVYYAFLRVNEDGTLRFLDEHADRTIEADGEQGCLAALAKLKAKHSHDQDELPRFQTLISIGGGGGSAEFPLMASSAARRATFAASCRSFIDEHGLDGVDIDWEHPRTAHEGANYVALLAQLRDALPSPRYLLTTALPVGEYCLQHLDLAAAGLLLDGVNLMGYDFTGPWADVSGHHAQLYPHPGPRDAVHPALRDSCHRGVDYMVSRGFPAHKIVLGIPAYARSFAGARGPGQPFRGTDEIEYNDLPREWIQDAKIDPALCAASYVDHGQTAKAEGLFGGKGGEKKGLGFVSFDVPKTVRLKADYVKQKRLGGLFYWTGVGDIKEGPESLVRTGWEVLNGKCYIQPLATVQQLGGYLHST